MKSKSLLVAAGVGMVLACAEMTFAHPGHGSGSGLAAGVAHPLSGLDHILAMIAVGLCAAQLGGRSRWMLPVAFIAAMLAGGVVALGGGQVPMVEQAIAATVLVLGLIVASGSRLAIPVTYSLVAIFAAFHGFAHGAEMEHGLAPAAYASGFVLSTSLLMGVGLGAGTLLKRGGFTTVSRLAGGAIAAGGLALLIM